MACVSTFIRQGAPRGSNCFPMTLHQQGCDLFVQVVKAIWAYAKGKNLQDPADGRRIVCNQNMRTVFQVVFSYVFLCVCFCRDLT